MHFPIAEPVFHQTGGSGANGFDEFQSNQKLRNLMKVGIKSAHNPALLFPWKGIPMRPVASFCARSLLLAGLVLLINARANAVSFTLDVYDNGALIGSSDATRLGCVDNSDGVSAHCTVGPEGIDYGPSYAPVTVKDLSMDIDSDPLVTGTMTVVNGQTTTQLYTFIFTLPVSSMPGSTLTGGSARGTITDTGSDGATISAGPSGAIYTPLIDGAPYAPPGVTQLLFGPYSDASGGGPTNIPSSSFGAPIPSYVGPSVASSIGIQLEFYLTGLDQTTITSNHVVVVPEPQTAALLGVGLAVLAIRHRR
ncbi:MAG TPA: PEP-CTERM sorting domain-containing protein [Myxococcota bacterium]|nr:PEP-CTERM sorting domain-containing protein [Myxococcota bacterium]